MKKKSIAKNYENSAKNCGVSVFDFLDYREYLQSWFNTYKLKYSWFSYNKFGQGVKLDASQVYRILQKQLHISPAALPRFCDYLHLQGLAKEYFELLVKFGKCRKQAESQKLFEQIINLRGNKARTLKAEQNRLYEKWYHSTLRALIQIYEVSDNYEEVGKLLTPTISAAQVRKSLELLENIDLVYQDNEGRWHASEKSVQTGGQVQKVMVRAYQNHSLDLAKLSLENHPPAKRDIRVINMAVDAEAFDDCIEIIMQAKRQLRDRIEGVQNPDRIMRLAHAFFPVAQLNDGGGNNEKV